MRTCWLPTPHLLQAVETRFGRQAVRNRLQGTVKRFGHFGNEKCGPDSPRMLQRENEERSTDDLARACEHLAEVRHHHATTIAYLHNLACGMRSSLGKADSGSPYTRRRPAFPVARPGRSNSFASRRSPTDDGHDVVS